MVAALVLKPSRKCDRAYRIAVMLRSEPPPRTITAVTSDLSSAADKRADPGEADQGELEALLRDARAGFGQKPADNGGAGGSRPEPAN